MAGVGWVALAIIGVAGIVWGAESFAEHLGGAAVSLGVSSFALALLLAGAEPEELATGVAASLRHAPAVAFGDVVGANVAMCLVALGVGAVVAPLPFGRRVRLYGLLGLPVGAICAAFAWNGSVSRVGGLVLVALYVVYVGVIWRVEGAPPVLGESGEIEEARERTASGKVRRRVGKDLALILAGVAAMSVGATLLVEGIRHVASTDTSQTRISLTLVGFATAFELVVLAVSASRRGATEIVVAAVVGSFAYNATMTLGASALARPLRISDAGQLHLPLIVMLGALALAVVLGSTRGRISHAGGVVLLGCYPVFVVAVLLGW
jgi:cation:H+ antiporter